jgi:hypothetical protein
LYDGRVCGSASRPSCLIGIVLNRLLGVRRRLWPGSPEVSVDYPAWRQLREELGKSLNFPPGENSSRSLLAYLKVDAATIVPEVHVPHGDLQKCLGEYGNPDAVFEVFLRGEKIFERTSEGESELSAVSSTKFFDSSDDEVVSFRRDSRGRVTSVAFQNGGAELTKLK